jgi:membrane protease YdiL (CAAX protease family)
MFFRRSAGLLVCCSCTTLRAVRGPSLSNSGTPDARRPFPVALWLALVFGAWTLMHALNRGLPIITARSDPALALLGWTCAKTVAWLLPTAWLTWRHARASSLRWLGLCTSQGLALAFVWSCAWVALQSFGVHFGLPLFNRPPPDLEPHRLVGALLIAPLFEELLFRGAMMRALRERGMRRELVVLLSALAFSALHLPGWFVHRGPDPAILGSFVSMAAFGVLLGYLRWLTPSLWAAVGLHAANNLYSTGALACLARAWIL